MLRITAPRRAEGTVLKLEGRIVSRWVAALEGASREAVERNGSVTLDLADVTFADRHGAALLEPLIRENVQLRNVPLFLADLMEAARDRRMEEDGWKPRRP